jgi:hypothetical protein
MHQQQQHLLLLLRLTREWKIRLNLICSWTMQSIAVRLKMAVMLRRLAVQRLDQLPLQL